MDSDENVPEKMEDEARNNHDNELEMYQVRLTIQELSTRTDMIQKSSLLIY